MATQTEEQKKDHLAKLNFCRKYLYLHDMVSESENDNIFKRIGKWQDKERVEISAEELNNVMLTKENPLPHDTAIGR